MRLFRKRETQVNENSVSADILRALIDTEKIDADKAMEIPMVAKAVNLISDTVALLPIKLYKENGKKTNEVKNDIRVKLLNDETGDTLNGKQFIKAMVRAYLLDGCARAYINKVRGEHKSLHFVENNNISITPINDPIFKDYDIQINGKSYKPHEFLKVTKTTTNGIEGKGIIDENSLLLSVAYVTLVYELKLLKTGGNKRGFVKSPTKLTQDALTALKNAWNRLYSGTDDNVVILNGGLEFQEASQTSVEMQLNEKKKTLDEQIQEIFNISSDFDKTIKQAILPVINDFECALNKDLLFEKEKGSYYFAFDTKEVLKGAIKERFEAYNGAIEKGWMTRNEVRYREDLEEVAGLDVISFGLADVIYDTKSKTYFTPNTKMTNKLDGTEVKNEGGEANEGGN